MNIFKDKWFIFTVAVCAVTCRICSQLMAASIGNKYWEQVAALDYFNEFKRNRKKYQTGYNYHRLHYFSVRFLMETLKFQQEVQDKFGTKKRSRSLAEVNLN